MRAPKKDQNKQTNKEKKEFESNHFARNPTMLAELNLEGSLERDSPWARFCGGRKCLMA